MNKNIVERLLTSPHFVCPLAALRSPQFIEILPIRLAQILVERRFFVSELRQSVSALFRSPAPLEPDEEIADRPTTTKSPVVRINDIVPEMAASSGAPVVSYLTPLPTSTADDPTASNESRKSNRPWTDEEKQLLCKTIVRFPPGTPRRWEKIADVLARHVSHVTEMAKQIQNTVGAAGNTFQENLSALSSPTTIDESLPTERSTSNAADWSQNDQKLFETALKNVSKDLPGQERWEQISRCVPGKTPAECLARYRSIVQMVRAKKTV